MTNALIFDCDGVLADTERYGHLPAFNRTFAEVGLPVVWSERHYGHLLKIGGGKERMATILTDAFCRQHGLPTDADGKRELLAHWHRIKTAYYTDLVRTGALPTRPGISRLVGEARQAGWKLAVASTSAEPSVRAVLEHVVGADVAGEFGVFAGDVVAAKKPAPDIYELALVRMGIRPEMAVVIEDSDIGAAAALAAGIATVVTVSSYTRGEDVDGAAAVLTCLGDDDTPAEILANEAGLDITDRLELRHLAALTKPITKE